MFWTRRFWTRNAGHPFFSQVSLLSSLLENAFLVECTKWGFGIFQTKTLQLTQDQSKTDRQRQRKKKEDSQCKQCNLKES